MPEYFLEGWGWVSRREYLGKTPNEDGDYPLEDSQHGVMSQQFSSQPEGLILKLNNPNIPGLIDQSILFDQTRKAVIRLTTHHALEVDLGQEDNPQITSHPFWSTGASGKYHLMWILKIENPR